MGEYAPNTSRHATIHRAHAGLRAQNARMEARRISEIAALLAVGAASLGTSCSSLVAKAEVLPAPGTALAAFKRDLGLAAEVRSKSAAEVDPLVQLPELDAETRARYANERERAEAALEDLVASGIDVDKLPSGADRVERLTRAAALVRYLKRPAEGRRLLAELLSEEPGYFPARELVGESHWSAKEYEQAALVWASLARAMPSEARYGLRHAQCLIEQKAPERRARGELLLRGMIPGTAASEAGHLLAGHYLKRCEADKAERVLRAAIQASTDKELRIELARTLRYQGKAHEGAPLLEALANEAGPLQARAIYQLLWVHRVRGEWDAALRRHRDLIEGNFEDFVRRNRRTLADLGATLEQEKAAGRRVSFSLIELRYLLRESKVLAQRREAIAVLRKNAAQVEGVDGDFEYVLENDAEAELRAEAALGLLELAPTKLDPLARLLADASPRNRMIAAVRLRKAPQERALPLLFDALSREQSEAVFTNLHSVLGALTGENIYLEAGQAAQAAGRARLVEQWRQRLGLSQAKQPKKEGE